MKNSNTICKECTERLPDLLLDPDSVPAELKAHAASCSTCDEELTSLRATFDALDAWTAPEPSPYFDTRMHARLREAQAQPSESLWERMRSFVLFSTGRSFRPAVSGALALVLVAGGGSLVVPQLMHNNHSAANSATVNDLKVLDNNAQALQQMDQLLDDSDDDTPPAS